MSSPSSIKTASVVTLYPTTEISNDPKAAQELLNPDFYVNEKDCPYTLHMTADQQVHIPAIIARIMASPLIARVAPGHREPGQNLSIFSMNRNVREALLKLIPTPCRNRVQMLEGGDMGDVANTHEIDRFLAQMKQMDGKEPLFFTDMILPGNHDCIHMGVFGSGVQLFLGFLLELETKDSTYRKDIFAPEVGGLHNTMDKKKLIEKIYAYYKEELNPVQLLENRFDGYRLKGSGDHSWSDTAQVFRDFWQKNEKGIYKAPVHYIPNMSTEFAEQEWLLVHAKQVGKYKTTQGFEQPVFMIGLDTMDLLGQSNFWGALNGHISDIQVHLVKAFMIEMKKLYPGARFIFTSHYPITKTKNVVQSGLNRVLSDESVIAFLAFHSHKRDLVDLNSISLRDELEIHRETQLPEITLPSVMDPPNEGSMLVLNSENGKPKLQIIFQGVEENQNSPYENLIDKQYEKIKDFLINDRRINERIDDPTFKRMSLPGEDFTYRDLRDLIDMHTGILFRPGRINSQIIQKTVIPTILEDARSYMHLFSGVIYLAFQEKGYSKHAINLQKDYEELFKALDRFDNCVIRQYSKNIPHTCDIEFPLDDKLYIDFDGIEAAIRKVNLTTEAIYAELYLKIAESKDPAEKEALQRLETMVLDMKNFLMRYETWLQELELTLRTKRNPSETVLFTNLFGYNHFINLFKTIQEYPADSIIHEFLKRVGKKSADEWKIWLQEDHSQERNSPAETNWHPRHVILASEYLSDTPNSLGFMAGLQQDFYLPGIMSTHGGGIITRAYGGVSFENEFVPAQVFVGGALLLDPPFLPTGDIQLGIEGRLGLGEEDGKAVFNPAWGPTARLGETFGVSYLLQERDGRQETTWGVSTDFGRLFEFLGILNPP